MIEAIRALNRSLGVPATFKELGVERRQYMAKLPQLAEKAFEDQCTTTNPRLPLISELEEILKQAYDSALEPQDEVESIYKQQSFIYDPPVEPQAFQRESGMLQ